MRNWSQYNKKLINQSSLEIYFSTEVVNNWYSKGYNIRACRPFKYSKTTIKSCLQIKYLLGLAFRQTQGFMTSLIRLAKLPISVPSYSQLCRRQEQLSDDDIAPKTAPVRSAKIIAIDSTGISLFTPGAWRKRKYKDASASEKWLKLHAAIDPSTGEILDHQLTESDRDDAQVACQMLQSGKLADNGNIQELLADGAYDTTKIYRLLCKKKIRPNIKIRSNASYSAFSCPERNWRDQQILKALKAKFDFPDLSFKELLRQVRIQDRYGRRSLVETLFSRLKAHFGDKSRSRKMPSLQQEFKIKMNMLNRFLT